MRLHFKTNDYLLTWNLLFGASYSPKIHAFKQSLYKKHVRAYRAIQKDKKEMLEDIKNFIPDDDTLYNYVFETSLFSDSKIEAEKHRTELLQIWDKKKKDVNEHLKDILKFPLKDDYNIIILDPIMNSELSLPGCVNIAWGKRKDLENGDFTISNIIHTIVKNELGKIDSKYEKIVDAILELAIKNELYTRLSGKSNYLEGDTSLTYLKRQIYPYFLMYLGLEQEDFPRLMMRDGITFDIEKYTVDEKIKKLNLLEFIEYCLENQWRIVRVNQLEII